MLRKRAIIVKVFYDDLNLVRIYTKDSIRSIRYNGSENTILNLSEKDGYKVITIKVPTLRMGEKESLFINDIPYEIKPRGIVKTKWFEETFDATSEVMGAVVKGDQTTFTVYAPTHYSIHLKLEDTMIEMERKRNGVFTTSVEQNCHGMSYIYIINNELGTTDPYAKASLPNRGGSVVVDWAQIHLDIAKLEVKENPIILETHVRDFSMDPQVPFKHRGQFLGMLESHGHYGMSHIKDLGVTHVQLMPINDFQTVNELNPSEGYNWGYDPMQFMALEGSYSSNVHDPMQVIYDFAKLVDGYHKANIGINVDVVFNHTYEVDSHPFHILVPYYYYRYDKDFDLSNGSFVGNEIASEAKMMRKYIVETTKYYVETFKIDGYRFDLMGLLDVLTMNLSFKACQKINPHVMFYGEGWQMPTVLPEHLQAHMFNNRKMPGIGHFNDRFRDYIAGPLNDGDLGYAGNDLSEIDKVKAALLGNSSPKYGDQVFDMYQKSVNYVECHDNMTLADKVALSPYDKKKALFLTGMVLFSRGIPFLQIGQSFFRDRKGVANSYNSSDDINMIRWHYLDDHSKMNEKVKKWIKVRQDIFKNNEQYHIDQYGPELHFTYGHKQIIFDPTGNNIFIND